MIKKLVIQCAAVMSLLTVSLFVHAENAEQAMLKVTIAVDGMMKSKSGAT